MQPTTFRTLPVPAAGAFTSVYKASESPVRILARNLGAVNIVLAFTTNDVVITGGGNIYTIPPGVSDVIVVQPKQTLYASGVAGASTLSISASEAIPFKA